MYIVSARLTWSGNCPTQRANPDRFKIWILDKLSYTRPRLPSPMR
jgi:hypothetical protein